MMDVPCTIAADDESTPDPAPLPLEDEPPLSPPIHERQLRSTIRRSGSQLWLSIPGPTPFRMVFPVAR